MSERCAVCGKQRAASPHEKPSWVSRIGYGIAYITVIAPFAYLLLAFPFFSPSTRTGPRKAPKMCQVCEWTFTAFAFALLIVAAGVAYLVITVPNE
jgi:hypothetical protein